MSKKCRMWHDWSKQHLVETYSNQLIQISICKTCGQFDTQGISLTAIKRYEIQKLWNRYHSDDAPKVPTLATLFEAQAFIKELEAPTEKWSMPEWMIPFCDGTLLADDKFSVETLMNQGNVEVADKIRTLETLYSKGLLSGVELIPHG